MVPSLNTLLNEVRDDLDQVVCEQLQSSHAPHYRTADPRVLADRSARLVDAFTRSADDNPAHLLNHVRRIAEERISEGYHLHEIQMALNILEREAWQLVITRVAERDALVEQLGLVTGIIGAAKDQLARVYLEHKLESDQRIAELEGRLDELFKGTDSMDLPERG
jgi:hypothetical protein